GPERWCQAIEIQAGGSRRVPDPRNSRGLLTHRFRRCNNGCGQAPVARCSRMMSRNIAPYWRSLASPTPCTLLISAGVAGFRRAFQHVAAGLGDRPAAESRHVERDDAGAVELAEDRAPFLLAVFLAHTEGAKLLVAEFLDPFGLFADEQVGQVLGAEPLAGARD